MSQLQDWWLRLATLPGSAPAPTLPGPLRSLDFDDQNYTCFAYTGTWDHYQGPNWPGGAQNNTGTSWAAALPSDPLRTFTTKELVFQGTAEEGVTLWGASEDGGPILLFVRALDQASSGWVQFGQAIGSSTYLYQWKPGNLATDPAGDVTYYDVSFLGQSYYDRMRNPGLVRLRGLPAGRYQFQVQKPANTTDPNDRGNKATYFDGITVYTRHPTFA